MRISVKRTAMTFLPLLMAACGTIGGSKTSLGDAVAPSPVVSADVLANLASPPVATTATRAQDSVAPDAQAHDPAARARFDAALRAMRQGRGGDAQNSFDALAKDYPKLSGPLTNMGIIYEMSGRHEDALNMLRQATLVNPANAVAWTWLGSLYRQSGHLTEAGDAYRHAIAAKPGYAPAHLDLAILYDVGLHQPGKAAEEYAAYFKLSPGRPIASVWFREASGQPTDTAPAEVK